MGVPAAAEVLTPGPLVAGNPADIRLVATRLTCLGQLSEQRQRSARLARLRVAENSGLAVAALGNYLEESLVTADQAVIESTRSGQTALLNYGEGFEAVHMSAQRLQQQTEAALTKIGVCARSLEGIAWDIGIAPEFSWNSRVPIHMPEPWGRSDGSVDPAEHMAARYAALEWEWRNAALVWHASLDDIDRARTEWSKLREYRIELEQRLVRELQAAMPFTAAVRRTGTAAPASFPLAVGGAATAGLTIAQERQNARAAHPLVMELHRKQFGRIALGLPFDAFVTEQWWQQLSLRERQSLVQGEPFLIGNLDGVPIKTRIEANAVSAGDYSQRAGISVAEQQYWEQVETGSVQLVVSDPENSRIVEMIGVLGPDTQRVITYVPGTGARMKSFYEGEAQQVAHYLAGRAPVPTVAFVYKDGPWVSWAGANRNTNYEFLAGLGEQLSGFQSAVIDREPSLGDATRIGVVHSAGMTVLSGAEVSGTKFDRVLSLGGSFALKEWEPAPGTEYHHFQYDNDVINRIDGGRLRTPHEMTDVFSPHIFDSEGKAEMQSHSRIADGPETNRQALDEMLLALKGSE